MKKRKLDNVYLFAFFIFLCGIWLGFFRQPGKNDDDLNGSVEAFRRAQAQAAMERAYTEEQRQVREDFMTNPKEHLDDSIPMHGKTVEMEEEARENIEESPLPEDIINPNQRIFFNNVATDFSVYEIPSYRDTKSLENREVLNQLSQNVLMRSQ